MNTRPPLLYRIIQLFTAPVIALYFAARYLTNGHYRPHFAERLGRLPKSFSRTKAGAIWLHAVSAGEVSSAVSLLRELRGLFPDVPLYLSVSTIAGRITAERQAASLIDGLFYAPIDYASCVRRTLAAIRPALLVIIETEIWPNLYFETLCTGARLVIVNGRISNRSWPQYQATRWFFCPVLQGPDLVLVQTPLDYQRYRALGVAAEKLAIGGNLKYDAACSTERVPFFAFGANKIWIAASTAGPNERGSNRRHFVDEDDLVLEAFTALSQEFPGLLLILAPRQPDRFDAVARKIETLGIRFARRSHNPRSLALPAVLLLDTVGELAGLYHAAAAVFVGGSIAPRGGHNILEPAAAGVAILTGRHMQNFETIARDFEAASALIQVAGKDELLAETRTLLQDSLAATQMGERARRLVEGNRGVSKAVARRIQPIYYSASLRQPRSAAARLLLAPLAFFWGWGGRWKRDRSEHRAASLRSISVPVVSVGGITIGGAGKTPFVNYLAGLLQAQGHSPAILTRGYRRRYPAEHLVFPAGAKVSPFFTGDEAQIFLRSANAPVGIGVKRYETAQIVLRQFPATDVFLLDDGFQHALMPRDLDIVVIDGLDPFGREELVPLGRLREPLSALARAGMFIVTRVEDDRRFQAVHSRLREYNATAPIFRTHLISRGWRDYRTGEQVHVKNGCRAAAFCGLGNPQNFWNTLATLGVNVVFRCEFDDHHCYRPGDIARLAHQARMYGAQVLLTTEKDRINIPDNLEAILGELALGWLQVELKLEEEAEFLRRLGETVWCRREELNL